MKDLGLMHYLLGLEVWKSLEGIFLNQGKYAEEILNRFNMLVLRREIPMAWGTTIDI